VKRLLPKLLLSSSVQLLLGVVSPKISAPTVVNELLRWTVLSAVRSNVLKSAVHPVPLGIIPFCQFVASDQSPVPVVLIQVLVSCPCVTQAAGPNSRIPAAKAARHMIGVRMTTSQRNRERLRPCLDALPFDPRG